MFPIRNFISFMQFHSFLYFSPRCFSSHPVMVILFFSQHNDVVSLSQSSIFLFLCFSWFPHCPWMRPLVQIAAYIGSTLLSNRIISICHHCFSTSTMSSFHRHRCWLLYFEVFLLFTIINDCNHSLGFLIILEITLLSDQIIAIYHDCFSTNTMESFHHHYCWLLYF